MPLPETSKSREWDEAVLAEAAQTERVRDDATPEDFWRGIAGRFRPPGKDEPEDPVVTVLARYLESSWTLIDVGAGGGRLAIPLASHCARVVAVEPSPAMLEQLRARVAERGVTNIAIVAATWEEAEVDAAEVVLCAQVLYTAAPVAGFVGKLIDRAARRVAIVINRAQPLANYHPLWPAVHGEERIGLPGLDHLRALLGTWGIEPEVHELPEVRANLFPDRASALARSAQRLFVSPGSEKARRLEAALGDALVPAAGGGLRFRWGAPNVPCLVTWATG